MSLFVTVVEVDPINKIYTLEDSNGSQFKFDEVTLKNYISSDKLVCSNYILDNNTLIKVDSNTDFSRGKKLEAEKRIKVKPSTSNKYVVAALIIDNTSNSIDSAIVYSPLLSDAGNMAIKQIGLDEITARLKNEGFTNLTVDGNTERPTIITINKGDLAKYAVLDINYCKKSSNNTVNKIASSRALKVKTQNDMLITKPNIGLNSDIEQASYVNGEIRTTRDVVLALTAKRVTVINSVVMKDPTIYIGDTDISGIVNSYKIKKNIEDACAVQHTYAVEADDDERYVKSAVSIEKLLGDSIDIKLRLDNSSNRLIYKLDLIKDNEVLANIFNRQTIEKDKNTMYRVSYALMGIKFDLVEQKFGILVYESRSKYDMKSQREIDNAHNLQFIAIDIR